jgi:predicted transcriptional regulator
MIPLIVNIKTQKGGYLVTAIMATKTVKYNPKMDQLMHDAGLDITQFSRQANLSYGTAHDILVNGITDGRRLKTIRKIAKVLNISLSQLFQVLEQ